ncbi:MAG: lytic transglycosylase domain-containing protein, partial [Gammaproteobacteria bacterium]
MAGRPAQRLARTARWLTLALVLGAVGSVTFIYVRWLYREHRFNRLIEEIAPKPGVDKFLVKAVIHRESGFDPFAYGRAGEIGLMQVTYGAGLDWARAVGRKDYGRDLLWDPRVNIEAGTWYLARALRRWPDKHPSERLPFALAEYNAGLGNVQRWLPRGRETTAREFTDAVTIPSVREYIETVTSYYLHYQA